MAHAFAPHARQRHLDRALLADDAFVFHALVLAAQALVILNRPKDARAEQPVALGLEGAIVDGLGLFDLAVRPRQNLLRARDRNPDLVEDLSRHLRAEEIHKLLIHYSLRFRRQTTDDRRLIAVSCSALCPPSSDYSAASDM